MSVAAQPQFDILPLPVTSTLANQSTFAVGDIDRDGNMDLVWAENTSSVVALLNEGQLRFNRTTGRFPGVFTYDTRWVLGDLDGDGAPEIVLVDSSLGTSLLWRNDGRGFYSLDRTSLPSDFPRGLALGDFDGDSRVDIAAAFPQMYPSFVEFWRNTGSRFVRAASIPGEGVRMAAADLNGDGRADLFGQFRNFPPGPYGYMAWLSAASWTFAALPPTPWGRNFYSFSLGDFDGDGDLDLLDASWFDPTVWLNDGTGRLALAPNGMPSQVALTVGSTVGDFDGDGDIDIFFGNGDVLPHRDQLFYNDGRARFVEVTATRLAAPPSSTFQVEAADLDRDGDLDVVASGFAGGLVYRNMLRHAEFVGAIRIGQTAVLSFAAQRGYAATGQVVLPALSTIPLPPAVVVPPFGTWRLAPAGLILLSPLTVPAPSGVVSVSVPVPGQTALVGQTVSLQAIVAHTPSPSTWRFTGVARATIER